MDNLRMALGSELNEEEIKKISRNAYVNISITFVEMLMAPKHEQILRMVDISDIDVMKQALAKERGLILISCHFCNWELNGGAIAAANIPFIVVAKRQSNPHVDRFINKYRSELGMKVIRPGASVKHIVRALRKGSVAGLIADQDAGRNGVFVFFFGQKASTPRGSAQLALKYGSPIILTMIVRTVPGRYKAIFKEIDVLKGDTVESLTQRYTKVIEDFIRQHPEQYFWMHRRWKTRVEEEQTVIDGSVSADNHNELSHVEQ